MTVVVELETEHGGRVCFNPQHVVSVLGVVDAEPPLSVVADVSGAKWRVRGAMHQVAAHLFADPIGGSADRLARTVRVEQPMVKERVPHVSTVEVANMGAPGSIRILGVSELPA